MLSGCAWLPATPQTDHLSQPFAWSGKRQLALTNVPVVLQEPDFCGPAALSMALQQAGLPVSQDELAQKVFLPGRAGTLQTDMLAGPRHFGFVGYELDGQLSSLLKATEQGHSPIVLLNLGLSWAPQWHYALVIGYDLDQSEIILRSGTYARQAMPLRTFEHTWARSQHWAMVLASPGSLPTTVDAIHAEQAALGFEQVNQGRRSIPVWASIAQRWPNRLLAQLALGNAYMNSGQWTQAAHTFEKVCDQFDSAIAWNNLAQVHLHQGHRDKALVAAQRGLQRARTHEPRWIEALTHTLQTIPTD
ncbi:MAG: hypothetical protein RLZZ369_1767 [Pseudomonadota bacterium]|jgi:tetratricopeptide (TPR) repeat protein